MLLKAFVRVKPCLTNVELSTGSVEYGVHNVGCQEVIRNDLFGLHEVEDMTERS